MSIYTDFEWDSRQWIVPASVFHSWCKPSIGQNQKKRWLGQESNHYEGPQNPSTQACPCIYFLGYHCYMSDYGTEKTKSLPCDKSMEGKEEPN